MKMTKLLRNFLIHFLILADEAIQKKNFVSGITKLTISNEEIFHLM